MTTGRLSLAGLALAVVLATIPAATAGATEQGRRVFQEKCVACHTIGGGDLVGPDLAGVVSRRDRAWLARWLAAPDRLLAEGDPIATALLAQYRGVPMPNQGLGADEVEAVLAYLAADAQPAPAPGAAPAPAGDPGIGKELFTGTRRFANQGPACMACHSIAGIGALGGGALGPDLTLASSKFGEAGLASILAGMPFPTMQPIFTARPLTGEEQRHLQTFIAEAAVVARAPSAVGRLAALAVLGAVLGLGVAHLAWRRRLVTGVRRGLVERAHAALPARPEALHGRH